MALAWLACMYDDLLELYAANFNVNGTVLCSLIDSIAVYGSVNEGVDRFVTDEFLNDMRGQHDDGKADTFDEYVARVSFPYGDDAFAEYLRWIWDDKASLDAALQ